MCKNHLSFVSAAAGGCKFPFGSSFSFRFSLIVITPSGSLFALGSRSLHFVINFSLLICNILATLYTLNFSNNPLRKSQCIRLSHFLMNVFKLGKPEYFFTDWCDSFFYQICDIYLISKTSEQFIAKQGINSLFLTSIQSIHWILTFVLVLKGRYLAILIERSSGARLVQERKQN